MKQENRKTFNDKFKIKPIPEKEKKLIAKQFIKNGYEHYKHIITFKKLTKVPKTHKIIRQGFHKGGTPNINGIACHIANDHWHVLLKCEDDEWFLTRKYNKLGIVPNDIKFEYNKGCNNYGDIRDRIHYANTLAYISHYPEDGEDSCSSSDDDDEEEEEDDREIIDTSTIINNIRNEIRQNLLEKQKESRGNKVDSIRMTEKQKGLINRQLNALNNARIWYPKGILTDKQEMLRIQNEEPLTKNMKIEAWNIMCDEERSKKIKDLNTPITVEEINEWQSSKYFQYNDHKINQILYQLWHKTNINKKTPILWLRGAADAGKTVIGKIIASIFGKYELLNQNSLVDTLGLDDAAKNNPQSFIFEEFALRNFKHDMSKAVDSLKMWTSGEEFPVRTKKTGDSNVQYYLKLDCVIIMTNNSIEELHQDINSDVGLKARSCIYNFLASIPQELRFSEEERDHIKSLMMKYYRWKWQNCDWSKFDPSRRFTQSELNAMMKEIQSMNIVSKENIRLFTKNTFDIDQQELINDDIRISDHIRQMVQETYPIEEEFDEETAYEKLYRMIQN